MAAQPRTDSVRNELPAQEAHSLQVAGSPFVLARLPWIIGGIGLAIFLNTINPWISLQSLGIVARTSGWLWQPELGRPLTFLLLYPFRGLPESAIPLALNLFTAVCAAVVLTLLARSVALLRHDIVPAGLLPKGARGTLLSMPVAWMPPVAAATVCGLQLSFWEHATSATGEMLDLLVAAYAIRCLLEFKTGRDDRWLARGVFVYAAGMANNWAMIGFLPVFIAAMVVSKGLGAFFEQRFIARMLLWSWAGLSLYVLLPVIQTLAPGEGMSFQEGLKAYLEYQKSGLFILRVPMFQALAIASVVPLLVLAFRWKSHTIQFGDDSRLGVLLIKLTGHAVHVFVFATTLWLAFDPAFSPRGLELGLPMLTYYYVSSIVCGYALGYLLIFALKPAPWQLNKAVFAALSVLVAMLPLLLLWRNLEQVRLTNGPALRQFTQQLYGDLPKGKSVVLSEEAQQLFLLRAELSAHHYDKEALLLEIPALPLVQYHFFMANQFKSHWPVAPPVAPSGALTSAQLFELTSLFMAREPVIHLHPGFGFFFEWFDDRPEGYLHYLTPRPGQELTIPPLPETVIATNEQIWQRRWSEGLQRLAEQNRQEPGNVPEWLRTIFNRLHLKPRRNENLALIARQHSKPLNYWGVELQRAGRWNEAAVWFDRALRLNPENLCARVNADYNRRRRQDPSARLDIAALREEIADDFPKSDWRDALSLNGPIDEPTFLLKTGRRLLTERYHRQAMRDFSRATALAPDWLAPRLALAECHLELRNFAGALKIAEDIDPEPIDKSAALAQLLYCRTTALRGLGRTSEATASLQAFMQRYGGHVEVSSMAATLCGEAGDYEEELALLTRLVLRQPKRPDLMSRKGIAEMRLGRYEEAIASFNETLSLAPGDDESRLRRAVAALGAGRLEEAAADYEDLLQRPATSQQAMFGLAGIAWRRDQTNDAIRYYRAYLSNCPPNSVQYAVATERLRLLKGEAAR